MKCSHIVVLLLALSACTRQQAGHTFRVVIEDGVDTAVTSGGPKHTESLFNYEAALTLEEDPARPETILYRPSSICMDQRGYFYVVDTGNGRIAVFDPQGSFVRSFGRKGNGPGEFQSMYLLHFFEDVLSIHDSQNLRTTRYKTDGTLLEVVSDPKKRSRLQRLHRASGDRFVYELYRDSEAEGAGLDDAYGWMGRRAIVISADDDTLAILETPWVKTSYTYSFSSGSGGSRMAYSGRPEALYVPGRGILISTGVTPEIEWYDLGGDLSKRLRFELNPEPVTSKEKGTIRQKLMESFERDQARLPSGLASRRRDALKFHEHKAFWDWIAVDDAGYLWLGIPEEYDDMTSAGGRLNRVISPDGEYLGNSRWPCRSGTVYGGMFIGYVENEDTDELLPTVFRIVPIVKGLNYP